MNRLYGLLTYNAGEVSGWYAKLHTPAAHSVKSKKICDALTSLVPNERLPLFACAVCKLAMNSIFRNAILELDPENTYDAVVRDPSAPSGDSGNIMCDMVVPAEGMQRLIAYFDKDIKETLVVPNWPEIASAACLQMLRDAL